MLSKNIKKLRQQIFSNPYLKNGFGRTDTTHFIITTFDKTNMYLSIYLGIYNFRLLIEVCLYFWIKQNTYIYNQVMK